MSCVLKSNKNHNQTPKMRLIVVSPSLVPSEEAGLRREGGTNLIFMHADVVAGMQTCTLCIYMYMHT